MTDPKFGQVIERDPVRRANRLHTASGYSGQDYRRDREADLARQDPLRGLPSDGALQTESEDIPPQNGRRASFDPATGAVHGSGSGAGGGNPGEDFDTDPTTGSGYPQTGAQDEADTVEAAKVSDHEHCERAAGRRSD